MSDNTYNGWTNYATWNIPLWVDNDYNLYMLRCDWLKRRKRPVTGKAVRWFVREYMGGTTPDLKGNKWEGGRVKDVNWEEIAESWEEERLELTGEEV